MFRMSQVRSVQLLSNEAGPSTSFTYSVYYANSLEVLMVIFDMSRRSTYISLFDFLWQCRIMPHCIRHIFLAANETFSVQNKTQDSDEKIFFTTYTVY